MGGSDVSGLVPNGEDCIGWCRAMSTFVGNNTKNSRWKGIKSTTYWPWAVVPKLCAKASQNTVVDP